MAEFDENKVINALHPEKAEIGKKYWFSDDLFRLKKYVEKGDENSVGILERIEVDRNNPEFPFCVTDYGKWKYLHPYEEEPKKRMTNRQLAEWIAKGNGEFTFTECFSHIDYSYNTGEEEKPISEKLRIRTWNSEEWIEPTVDIYERDCRGNN